MTCDDFRGIAITLILCKLFEYWFLDKYQSLLTTGDLRIMRCAVKKKSASCTEISRPNDFSRSRTVKLKLLA